MNLFQSLPLLFLTVSVTSSFQTGQNLITTKLSATSNASSRSALFIVPEIAAANIVIAIASAAAGAAVQIPKVNELEQQRCRLEKDLELAKQALTSTEHELQTKISQLEDAIFEMDREFEGQTERAKKSYDESLRNELESLSLRLTTEFETKQKSMEDQFNEEKQIQLNIKEQQLQYKFLQGKFQSVQNNGDKRRDEIASTLHSQARLSVANKELEQALMAAKEEIEHLNQESTSTTWWKFGK